MLVLLFAISTDSLLLCVCKGSIHHREVFSLDLFQVFLFFILTIVVKSQRKLPYREKKAKND